MMGLIGFCIKALLEFEGLHLEAHAMSNLLLAFHSARRVLPRPRTDAFKVFGTGGAQWKRQTGNSSLRIDTLAQFACLSLSLSLYNVQMSPASEMVCRRGQARVCCSAATKASREITDKNLLWIHIDPEQCKVPASLRRPHREPQPTKLHQLKAFVGSHKLHVLSINQLCYYLKS